MTKQHSLLLGFLLLFGVTVQAFEPDEKGYHYGQHIEQQFNTLLKHNAENQSLQFNNFVYLQLFILLHGPDSIEELNKQMRTSGQPIPGTHNKFICDATLHKSIERSKRKHAALFDFVKKYQNIYAVDSPLLAKLRDIEEFAQPITCEIGTCSNGRAMTAQEFFSSDADPADKESLRITLFENKEARLFPITLERLPSEQAIKDLPLAVQNFRELQNKYKKIIQDYPNHKDRAHHQEQLTKSERAIEMVHPEYLKKNPSKKEIEKICMAQFLRKIGYGKALQERVDKVMESNDSEEQKKVIFEAIKIAESIKEFAEKYPTMDPENSQLLHKAADQIYSGFGCK